MRLLSNEISICQELKIKTYDIDIAGHVNNAVYIKWFEELRTKLFVEYFNLPGLLLNNVYPIVISTEIFYKKFLKLFDKPTGKIYLQSCNHGIITLNAEILLNQKIIAAGRQKCVLYNLTESKIVKSSVLEQYFLKVDHPISGELTV